LSWTEAALGDVCSIVSGATPKTGTPEFWGDEVPWLTPADMSRDRRQVLSGGARGLTNAGLASCSARLVPPGAVIVSSRAPVGYVAIAGAEMATNQGCKTAVPPDFIDPRYLYWYLIASRDDLEARASGTTFKEISAKEFGRTRLRWPGMAEQHRIVDILEDHLSRLDASEHALGDAQRRASGLLTSTMARLVAEASEVGELSTVGAEAELVEYGSSAKAHVDAIEGDIPVLRMGNIREARLSWDSLKYLPGDHSDLPRLLLKRGDLLFNRTNSAELVGKSAVFDDSRMATFASYLIRARFKTRVLPDWANIVVNSPQGRDYVASVVSQQVGQANVNGTKLRAFPMPVPTLDDQIRSVAIMTNAWEAVGRLRSATDLARLRAMTLRRALLIAAFTGKLAGAASDADWIEELAATE
jgi:type I restriction enzyme S subunit